MTLHTSICATYILFIEMKYAVWIVSREVAATTPPSPYVQQASGISSWCANGPGRWLCIHQYVQQYIHQFYIYINFIYTSIVIYNTICATDELEFVTH